MWFLSVLLLLVLPDHCSSAHRIAVVGGGLTGTFVAKYLTDLDRDCSLGALAVFDPHPDLGEVVTAKDETDSSSSRRPDHPPSRLVSYRSEDGKVYELGTAVLSERHFPLVTAMAKSGNHLTFERPLELGAPVAFQPNGPGGAWEGESVMIFHDGGGKVAFQVDVGNSTSTKAIQNAFLWRYNLDVYLLSRLAGKVLPRLQRAHQLLVGPPTPNDGPDAFCYQSPMALWEKTGLTGLVRQSMDEVCDRYMVRAEVPFWRRYLLPGQGSFRSEVLNPMCAAAYHQNASQVNALAGLAAFLVASDLEQGYSIAGGNSQLVASAWEQARGARASNCPGDDEQDGGGTVLTHVAKRISTVVGSVDGFDLYDDHGEPVGSYDIVVLAVPMSAAKVDFLIKSHIDETVLQPMPLGGLVENSEDTGAAPDHRHEGHSPLPPQLPKAVTRPYVQAVSTLVRNAFLQGEYWFGKESGSTSDMDGTVMWQIYMTAKGNAEMHNITAVHQMSAINADEGGHYKIVSSQPLSLGVLRKLFGPTVEVEYEQIWEAVAPDYQGEGSSTDFLIYDGATGFHGHTRAGALYYPNSMELTLANLEAQAMGARAVANLIASRLEWLETKRPRFGVGDEL